MEPRIYSRRSFWSVKILMIIAGLIVLWNIAAEHGRQEIRSIASVQAALSGNPNFIWGNMVYPATEFNSHPDRFGKMTVKVKERK